MNFEAENGAVSARFVARPEHIGFQNTIHGGIISTVLDEIMVWACGLQTKRFAYCAELNVRFVKPARPGEELLLRAGPVVNRKNKLFEVSAELRDAEGMLLASATGKYIPIKAVAMGLVLADFVEDTSGIFDD